MNSVSRPLHMPALHPDKTTWARYIHSQHISDLRGASIWSLVVLIVLLSIFLSAYFVPVYAYNIADNDPWLLSAYLASFHSPVLLAASGTAIAAWGVFVSRLYDVARERFGTVDIFEADITAICRIIYAVDVISGYVTAYRSLKLTGGLYSTVKRENYFEVLEASFKELSALGPVKIDAIISFYTFLRGARDTSLSFNNWVNKDMEICESSRKTDVVQVAYLLFLSLESAQTACIALMEKTDGLKVSAELANRHATDAIPISLTGLVLYKYLHLRMIEKMKIQLLWFLDKSISIDEREDERRLRIELRLQNEKLREHPAFHCCQERWGAMYEGS